MRPVFAYTLFFLSLCHGLRSSAKEDKDLLKANYLYTHYAYYEAIPYYEKAAALITDPATFARVGDCYRLTNNLAKAGEWYAKAVKTSGYKTEVMLHYAQTLMSLGEYADAEKWLKDYKRYNKADKRITNLVNACERGEKNEGIIPAGMATLLDFSSNGSEFAPTIWKGKLVFSADSAIHFKKKTDKWSGNSYFNIYSVTIDSLGHCANDINEITDAKSVNTKYHNGPCTFSADGNQMYYTRTRYKKRFLASNAIANDDTVVLLEIMIASGYDEKTHRFREIAPFQYNSEVYSVAHPTVSPNGLTLVYSSNMKGVGGCDLFYCRKTSSGTWSKPENIGRTINTEGDELFPYFADNNTLYFSSDGHEGYGGLDVYVSKWNERTRAFGTPENLGLPVNSAYDDISLAMYADRRSSYFSSNRPGLKSGDNIYFFKRHQAILDLRVIDSVTKKPIADAKVKLDNEKDNRDLATDEDGHLYSPMYTESDYIVTAGKERHSSAKTQLNTTVAGEVDTFIRQLALLSYDTIQPIAAVKPPPPRKRFDSPAVVKYEVNQAYEIPHFFYKLDEYKLNDMKRSTLDNLVGVLKKRPTMDIRIQAHCDCRGSDDYNQVLSDNRAAEVVKYLVRKGISKDRLSSKGYGKRRPTVPCPDCSACTDEQHAKNRVVEFVVVNL